MRIWVESVILNEARGQSFERVGFDFSTIAFLDDMLYVTLFPVGVDSQLRLIIANEMKKRCR